MGEFDELLKTICEAVHRAEGGHISDACVGFELNGSNWTAKALHAKRCVSHGVGDTPIKALRSLSKETANWYATVVRENRVAALQNLDKALGMLRTAGPA